MQGKKQLQPKVLYTITLEQLVPADNFYRRLNKPFTLTGCIKSPNSIMAPKGRKALTRWCSLKYASPGISTTSTATAGLLNTAVTASPSGCSWGMILMKHFPGTVPSAEQDSCMEKMFLKNSLNKYLKNVCKAA